ncbi:chemotaxis protein CheW [Paraglaciecola aquimarina]|uniref:Chemotaxis protein CheW n=1 Tax=Paraglaciecola aquimarina TaxID=1235557 RepID=A0ABU3T093_9ALTE|nr:chemotaxis protein CheW [Paraglaciecola aquimarina]MDU0355678.1 chemotaxis protein CheW [Paraglaciecola aquimarina]
MSRNPFANENVMEDYMSALLTDEPAVDDLHRQSVETLLKTAPAPRSEPFELDKMSAPSVEPLQAKVILSEVEEESIVKNKVIAPKIPETEFQVLLFEVAGLTLAVPLTELGGIHEMNSVNPLFGKPSWFKGVLLHREEKYNVVDTTKWIMPEKSVDKLAESTKYQYLIVLGESGWGLGCENLITTETLMPDDVKWRNVEGSRPWLFGMVKKKMCALINVQQMISMLNQGLSSND